MSYGIYLYRPDAGAASEPERRAFLAALERWGWDGTEERPYLIGTEDALTVEVYASGLHGSAPFVGCNLEVRGFSTELCRLVLDLARAAGLAISHDGEADAVILTDEAQRGELPADMADHPKLMVCPTPESLAVALEDGFEAWAAFRDHVLGLHRQ